MTEDSRSLCALCAWRQFCQKKFNMEGALHCPDYSKDVSFEQKNKESDSKTLSKAETDKKPD